MTGPDPDATGAFPYRALPGWDDGPRRAGLLGAEVADLAVAGDEIYLLTREEPRVVVTDREGTPRRSWGEGELGRRPHGITVAGGRVYVVDDPGHVIRVFDDSGTPVAVVGQEGVPSGTGVDDSLPVPQWTATVARSAGPFNHPTKVAVAADGGLFVSDGYGNARVHRFGQDLTLRHSWGAPGTGPGQFNLPHSVIVLHDGTVLVADRENDRLLRFTPDGEPLASWEAVWRPTGLARRADGAVVVSSLPWRVGETSARRGTITRYHPAAISVLDTDGELIGRHVGGPGDGDGRQLIAPHGVAVDDDGTVYVAEVGYSYTGRVQPVQVHVFAAA